MTACILQFVQHWTPLLCLVAKKTEEPKGKKKNHFNLVLGFVNKNGKKKDKKKIVEVPCENYPKDQHKSSLQLKGSAL